jgi:hypothetical protein
LVTGRKGEVAIQKEALSALVDYGVEERALVLALVKGPTLAERIARGAMPLDEAPPVANPTLSSISAALLRQIGHSPGAR